MFIRAVTIGLGASVLLTGCKPDTPSPPPMKVIVVSAEMKEYAPVVVLTGDVAARVTSDLSFRVTGQILDRKAEVGDHVAPGQVLATLQPQEQQADLASSQATVSSAEAQLRQAALTFDRQRALIGQGYTTRREYDQAEATLRTAQASLDSAKAQLGTTQDQLNQTTLRAGAAGMVTARKAEAGEVVQAAQTVYTLAMDGPRDAVFYVYESIFVREPADSTIVVALVADPRMSRKAKVREISPVVDAVTGTVRVKFEIDNPPPEMTLGAPVVGTGAFKPERVVALPWSALSEDGDRPAVWVVDPSSNAVALRRIEVESYEKGQVLVRSGLQPGQLVVSRGQQLLRPGQIVDPVPAPRI